MPHVRTHCDFRKSHANLPINIGSIDTGTVLVQLVGCLCSQILAVLIEYTECRHLCQFFYGATHNFGEVKILGQILSRWQMSWLN